MVWDPTRVEEATTEAGSGASAEAGAADRRRDLRGMTYAEGAAALRPTVEDHARWVVRSGDTLSRIADAALGDPARWQEILELNGLSAATDIHPGDVLLLPGEASTPGPATSPRPRARPEDPASTTASEAGPEGSGEGGPLDVERGQLTFDVEGSDDPDSPYFSRRLHHPTAGSGVTLGRGYDMKHRSREEVLDDLLGAGLDPSTAETLSGAAGLTGDAAETFVREHRDVVIDHDQQKALFDLVYAEKATYAAGRIRAWSGIDLAGLEPVVQDVLVDLFYRGDMTWRKWTTHGFAEIVQGGDLEALLEKLTDKGLWGNVDANRYRERIRFVNERGSRRYSMAP